MPNELAIADVQQSFFEYRVNFEEIIAEVWYGGRHGQTIQVLLRALSPWHVGLENVTWNQAAKNGSEIQLTLGVPSLVASVQVGLGGLIMTAFNPDWSRAAQLVAMFQAALDAVRSSTGRSLQKQQTTLGFHVKAGQVPFRNVLTEFVNVTALGAEGAAMFGVSVYYDDYSFVIDGSALFPGSVFLKLIRNFPAEERFDQMAKVLHSDEEAVLQRLGLKLQ